jgi:hypothetical protein
MIALSKIVPAGDYHIAAFLGVGRCDLCHFGKGRHICNAHPDRMALERKAGEASQCDLVHGYWARNELPIAYPED